MVSPVSTSASPNTLATQATSQSTTAQTATTQAASTQTNKTPAVQSAETSKLKSSSDSERYTAVQQSLSNSKTAINTASKANSEIEGQLKNVKDIATKLADEKITGKEREKLQADYSKARDSIIAAQDKATVKNGNSKTNLLTDSKDQTVSSNTRGGEINVASGKNAKALGLPEKIGSAADAKKLLEGDSKSAGSLANAQQTTSDNAKALKKSDADVSKRLESASLAAKAAQRMDAEKSGGRQLSAENAQKRDDAIAQANQAREQIKNQFSGLSNNSNARNTNSLAALFG